MEWAGVGFRHFALASGSLELLPHSVVCVVEIACTWMADVFLNVRVPLGFVEGYSFVAASAFNDCWCHLWCRCWLVIRKMANKCMLATGTSSLVCFGVTWPGRQMLCVVPRNSVQSVCVGFGQDQVQRDSLGLQFSNNFQPRAGAIRESFPDHLPHSLSLSLHDANLARKSATGNASSVWTRLTIATFSWHGPQLRSAQLSASSFESIHFVPQDTPASVKMTRNWRHVRDLVLIVMRVICRHCRRMASIIFGIADFIFPAMVCP